MKKGFELLRSRSISDQVNLINLEKKYNLEIPPIYKIFAKNFLLRNNSLSYETYIHPDHNDERYLTYYSYTLKPEIDFTGFNSIEDSMLFAKEIEQKDDIDYLTVGYCTIGGILLGLKGEHKDKTYYYDPDEYPQTHIELTNDIFDFVRGLEEILLSENELPKIKFSQLYKTWGTHSWLVKKIDN
ncbi:hypothetical protein BTO06_01545 [Tenacibaculum sp. SZ-18]|uniref:hypothetical protein n=1 Tax=Tenacibaculum sp. SZ-18 TaxID=754423 RepID=UPI000C2D38B9|nr:hypothetical protein [Tenacibaculum sp. SZ-18]AUC13916.1 hypothetical protein BTO06_01545 [Tenacibaculum sp. SZ-18]